MHSRLKRSGKIIFSMFLIFTLFIATDISISSVNIYNDNYLGIYHNSVNDESFISISEGSIVLFAYYDSDTNKYYRGSTSEGSIDSTYFTATFNTIKECDSEGMYYTTYRSNYIPSGEV